MTGLEKLILAVVLPLVGTGALGGLGALRFKRDTDDSEHPTNAKEAAAARLTPISRFAGTPPRQPADRFEAIPIVPPGEGGQA